MPVRLRWILGLMIAGLVTVVPLIHFRAVYAHGKRLREVTPDVLYRSGQMTADGFADAVHNLHLHTIINLQDEYPDPDISRGFTSSGTVKESELCRQLGVRYVYIPPDLIARRAIPEYRPQAIDRFLAVLDDPSAYPVLIHCHAGLHRTGIMTAVYRMEYQGWSWRDAIAELKANGFGEFPCTSANDYITQYLLTYRPGLRSVAENLSQRRQDREEKR
jgi:tyrosine-protein phosphatase SIW14